MHYIYYNHLFTDKLNIKLGQKKILIPFNDKNAKHSLSFFAHRKDTGKFKGIKNEYRKFIFYRFYRSIFFFKFINIFSNVYDFYKLLCFVFHDDRCDCPVGYTGKNCSENVDDCKSHICQNGAKCRDELNGYTCICPTGYLGKFCEIAPIQISGLTAPGVCLQHECQNNGLCYQPSSTSDYMCRCASGSVHILFLPPNQLLACEYIQTTLIFISI